MTNTTTKDLPRTSPCYARSAIEGTNSLREMDLNGKLNIRGDASEAKFVDAISQVLEMDLPISANSVNEHESQRLYCLGPDEWLLHCNLKNTDSLAQNLREKLAGVHCAVTEVSDYYTVLRLSGPDAEGLLRRGTPLDLHHSVFKHDHMTQTRFGHASILLHRLAEDEAWDIQVRWTYAEYLWDYLVSAMRSL